MFKLFKKSSKEKEQIIEEKVNQWNAPLEEKQVCASLDDNISISHQLFSGMDIIQYRQVESGGKTPLRCFLVFCEGSVDAEIINSNIIRPLMCHVPDDIRVSPETLLQRVIQVGETKTAGCYKDVVEGVMCGNTVLFAEGCDQAFVLNTKHFVVRAISEPDNEKVLVGPREGFTECLIQNISQIIRRLHTNDLKTKRLVLGKRTKTSVYVCYFDSLADKGIVQNILQMLDNIDIDGVLDSNYITELIRDKRWSAFRTTGYTERPDTVVGKLLEGRIAIFVDGSPMVLTIPYLFIENFQSSEDYYLSYYYTSFARILRFCAFLLTITIPSFYIAIVAFHQEMMPLELLIRIALERQKVPLPAALEAVVMLLVFDILRETGIRMPSNIGQALSIVGALVIGQAAVEASLVAAPMIIIVAATGITGLLVPKLNAPILLWRFFFLFLTSLFGFFGFTIAFSVIIIHITNLTSFGVEQVTIEGGFHFQHVKDIFIRAPWPFMIERPREITKNRTRQSRGDGNG
ncbi:spore germination protein [Oscillospiraceae bacterium MB08-C2-2]|nr:spore germination protein [Oscillospiraceae bacterium MB08-C2-2]